eukprot:UN08381
MLFLMVFIALGAKMHCWKIEFQINAADRRQIAMSCSCHMF